ncbi:MAG: helix-turn-helix transcriptional regulator [Thermotogaceae bacterium]|nr:helix-turn-helix transcriptional regulator [Thermotogaceae bacterium]
MRNNLRSFLLKNNITTKELSTKTGISQSLISMIQNGQRNPSFTVADRIASYFQIPVEDLFPQFKRQSPYPKHTSKVEV